jgi:hypothetical protein
MEHQPFEVREVEARASPGRPSTSRRAGLSPPHTINGEALRERSPSLLEYARQCLRASRNRRIDFARERACFASTDATSQKFDEPMNVLSSAPSK